MKVDRARVAKLAAAFGVKGTAEGTEGRDFLVSDASGHVAVAWDEQMRWSYGRKDADETPGLAPGKAEAEATARRVLAAAGIDVRGTAVKPGETSGRRSVNFVPRVDGVQVLGLATQVGFDDQGRVDHADGYLARIDALDDYDLAGPATVLARLKPPLSDRPVPAAELTEVHLLLELVNGGGRAYLVPAFLFSAGGVGTGPIAAVADSEFSPEEHRPVP